MTAQRQKTFVGVLLLASALLLPPSSVTRGQPTIKTNENAASEILRQESLARLGEACPGWKIRTMVWPSAEDLHRCRAIADQQTKADCLDWLAKFMKPEAIPKDLERYLVALANWGLFREEAKQKALCDVFICRFTQEPYVVHIQESPFNVIMSVADERLADHPKEREAHGNFIRQAASAFLHKNLVPDPTIHWVQLPPQPTADGRIVTRVQWIPPSLVITEESGLQSTDIVAEAKIGTFHINAETDGTYVRFDILKSPGGGPRDTRDPYVRRFGVAK
jgi:hypothetical protein